MRRPQQASAAPVRVRRGGEKVAGVLRRFTASVDSDAKQLRLIKQQMKTATGARSRRSYCTCSIVAALKHHAGNICVLIPRLQSLDFTCAQRASWPKINQRGFDDVELLWCSTKTKSRRRSSSRLHIRLSAILPCGSCLLNFLSKLFGFWWFFVFGFYFCRFDPTLSLKVATFQIR